jgi:glycosyltransferase involved in cell wall biosynthesis
MARRVLVVSDKHPAFSGGAAQLAAYRLYEAVSRQPATESFFIATADGMADRPLGVSTFQPFGANEYLIATHGYDPWLGSNLDVDFPVQFETALRRINPDVIHFQTNALVGLESIAHAKRILPGAIVVVGPQFPLLLSAASDSAGDAVLKATLERRFPGRSQNDGLLRSLYMRRFLLAADLCVGDNVQDVAQLVAAGLPADKVFVAPQAPLSPDLAPVSPARSELTIGIFGLDSTSDGLDVLLRAARVLEPDPGLRIEICPVVGDDNVMTVGDVSFSVLQPCEPWEVGMRMQDCHAILIPGSHCFAGVTLVEEARAARRPILCPDVGAVSSLVRHGVDGFHFAAASGAALAALIKDLLSQPEIVSQAQNSIGPPTAPEDAAQAMCALYDRVMLPS